MKILDALGNVLEEKVSVVKVDIVLGIQFVNEVIQNCGLDSLILRYKQDYNVEIYDHDFDRAEHIQHLHQLHVFDHENNMTLPINYNRDTLSVIYEWVGRHRTIFSSTHRVDAHQLFILLCHSYSCKSILEMNRSDCDFLFNYIYLRDFIDHTNLI
jgi:hypothetical protein